MATKGKEIVAKGIIKAMRGGAISIALTAFIFVAREGCFVVDVCGLGL
jgi:hypothetical protein